MTSHRYRHRRDGNDDHPVIGPTGAVHQPANAVAADQAVVVHQPTPPAAHPSADRAPVHDPADQGDQTPATALPASGSTSPYVILPAGTGATSGGGQAPQVIVIQQPDTGDTTTGGSSWWGPVVGRLLLGTGIGLGVTAGFVLVSSLLIAMLQALAMTALALGACAVGVAFAAGSVNKSGNNNHHK